MHLDVDVRFYDDAYKELGRGQVEIRSSIEGDPGVLLRQLSRAVGPLIEGLTEHARVEALANLNKAKQEKETV